MAVTPRAARVISVGAVISSLLLGCVAGPATQPSASPTNSPAGSASAASAAMPSVAPSPTIDIATAFEGAYGAVKSGIVRLDTTVTVGDVEMSISSVMSFNGDDSSATAETTLRGRTTTTAQVKLGGQRYVQTGNGPWLVDRSVAPSVSFGDEMDRLASSVTSAGVTTWNGSQVQKLVPPAGATVDPAAFGFKGAKDVTLKSLVFFARDDGTPVGLALELSWRQPSSSTEVAARLVLEGTFSALGVAQQVRAPDHVWQDFTSKTLAYRMSYPDDLDVETQNDIDWFLWPSGSFAGIGRDPRGSEPLNVVTVWERDAIKKSWKISSVGNAAFEIGGVRARVMTWAGIDPNTKAKTRAMEVVVVHGKYVYWLWCYAPPDQAATDFETFKTMLSTFSFE